jgi:hypothetical protein
MRALAGWRQLALIAPRLGPSFADRDAQSDRKGFIGESLESRAWSLSFTARILSSVRS